MNNENYRLYSIALLGLNSDLYLDNKYKFISIVYDISDVHFLYRNTVRETINAVLQIVVDRTSESSNKYENYQIQLHDKTYVIYIKNINIHDLKLCVLTNLNYPKRCALEVITKIISSDIPSEITEILNKTRMDNILSKNLKYYQNPNNIDKILQIMTDLNDTKEIMIKNIDSLLQRGEKIEDLIIKSEQLSSSSIDFHISARKLNKCPKCSLL